MTGRSSRLELTSPKKYGEFSVIPLSAGPVKDRRAWRVFANAYRVALVPDSLYEICHLPCSRPDTILLRAGAVVKQQAR